MDNYLLWKSNVYINLNKTLNYRMLLTFIRQRSPESWFKFGIDNPFKHHFYAFTNKIEIMETKIRLNKSNHSRYCKFPYSSLLHFLSHYTEEVGNKWRFRKRCSLYNAIPLEDCEDYVVCNSTLVRYYV